MNTLENNKLIAEFMGYKFYEHFPLKRNGWQRREQKDTAIYLAYSDDELKYHESWDWLMPVVEKLEDMGCEITQTNGECTISGDEYYEETYGNNRRHATFDAVVEFIKWYNENK